MYCRPAFRLHYLFLLLYGCPIGQRTVLGLQNLQRGPAGRAEFCRRVDGLVTLRARMDGFAAMTAKGRISRYGTAAMRAVFSIYSVYILR